ncbi:MAG: beta-ketoacyl synthase N-terminal-like domain-containing protein [Bacillota bacterium]
MTDIVISGSALINFENGKLDPALKEQWVGTSRMSEAGKRCCIAVGEALKSAGVNIPVTDDKNGERTALVVGNNHSNLEPISELYKEAVAFGTNHVNPSIFPNTVLNALSGYISLRFHIKGNNTTISSGDDTVPSSFKYALDLLEYGQHDKVIICNYRIKSKELKYSFTDCEKDIWISAFVIEKNSNSKSLNPSISYSESQYPISIKGMKNTFTSGINMDSVLYEKLQQDGACIITTRLINNSSISLLLSKSKRRWT